MTKAEKETVIRWDEEERVVSVYSCSAPVWNRCRRLGFTLMETQKDAAGVLISQEFTVPLGAFRWGIKSEARAEASSRTMRESGLTPPRRALRPSIPSQD